MDSTSNSRERIILVEDDPIIAEVTMHLLRKHQYQIIGHARSGAEAIKAVLTKPVDLVLMDIMLEGELDGIETAQYCYHLMHIPVVFVTGNMSEEILDRSKIAEPFGFLLKPITGDSLHSTIQIALNTFKCTSTFKADRVDDIRNIEEMGFGMIVLDINGRLLYLNPTADAMLHSFGKTLHYKPITDVFKPRDFQTEKFIPQSDFTSMLRSMLMIGDEKHLIMTPLDGNQKKAFVVWALPVQSLTNEYLGAVLILKNMEERVHFNT